MSQFKSGIYKITINDYYIYIGQSVNIEKRWKQHLSKLKQNKHCNKKLQNVFNKHPNSIKFEIIEECNENELDNKEMYWIGYYRTFNTNHGLNMSIGGDSGCRKFKTIEEAEIVRKEYAKQYYQDNKDKWKQRYQDNKDEIREYNNQYNNQYNRQKGILSHSERRKLQFEKRYNLSRLLTDEEWNNWRGTKLKDKPYVIKFLTTLPNLAFTTLSLKNHLSNNK